MLARFTQPLAAKQKSYLHTAAAASLTRRPNLQRLGLLPHPIMSSSKRLRSDEANGDAELVPQSAKGDSSVTAAKSKHYAQECCDDLYKPVASSLSADSGFDTHYAELLSFINYAWTPFHAVEEAARRLQAAGFTHIHEKDQWKIQPGGKYFFTRNMSTIVAFAVGAKYQPGNGVYMVGAHTDSPCLKLKPVTKNVKAGYHLLNVEPYGGGLWTTWFDRDLSLAGRVLVRGPDGGISQRLVKVEKPILRIPMLAIHLNRTINTDGFKINLQSNIAPILATTIKSQLTGAGGSPSATPSDSSTAVGPNMDAKHPTALLKLLAEHACCSPADIVDFELNVCDVQPGTLGGINDEFIFVGRLDNLAMSYCSIASLIESCQDADALAEETAVRAIALFDHEEVGSESAQGAGGPVMRDTITRVASALGGNEEGAVERALRASFLISADMAHALHPNYSDKHDPEHAPKIHGGLVVKHNVNQRYATNAVSAALFREIGRRAGVPCQEFTVRNDMPCGSTIGPILSSNLGCRTVDVGIPQFAMHSIRETCGTDDVYLAVQHFTTFFKEFSKLDATVDIDSLPPPNIQGTIQDPPCGHAHH